MTGCFQSVPNNSNNTKGSIPSPCLPQTRHKMIRTLDGILEKNVEDLPLKIAVGKQSLYPISITLGEALVKIDSGPPNWFYKSSKTAQYVKAMSNNLDFSQQYIALKAIKYSKYYRLHSFPQYFEAHLSLQPESMNLYGIALFDSLWCNDTFICEDLTNPP